jgi:hypothetical protein
MNCQQRTVGRCGKILAAAVMLALCGCHRVSSSFDSSMSSSKASSGERGVATVSWVPPTRNSDGSTITDLAGYTIYYGTSPQKMDEKIEVRDPGTTTYTVKKLNSGKTYYFSIVAFTAGGISGGATPTVSKVIP